MILMHECPNCSDLAETDPWSLARGDAFRCHHCGSTVVPSREMRRVAVRLLRVRKTIELERRLAVDDQDPVVP